MMVSTADGLIERKDLTVSFEISENEFAIIVVCLWHKGEREVRRDTWANSKLGLLSSLEQGLLEN